LEKRFIHVVYVTKEENDKNIMQKIYQNIEIFEAGLESFLT